MTQASEEHHMVQDNQIDDADTHASSPPEPREAAAPPITVSEAGRRGGRTTRDKYGPDHFKKIGKKGGQALASERGSAYYSALGEQGGKTLLEQRGPMFFSQIGRKGGAALKRRADPNFYREIGKLGGSAPRRTGRKAQQAPSGGRHRHPQHTEEAQHQLAQERQAQLAALPPSTHVSFTQKHPPRGHQDYWYATWLDRESGKVATLYLGKERPDHRCLEGTCTHLYRRHQPKQPAGRGGPPIGYQPGPEAIAHMRQAHLGKSNFPRKQAE